ncbi:MAG: MltA domain-containing protein [Deltaproteobacteria bacterium]|nr:MltA domain-containing protein [Deltaproteobacteria bacterium]
MTGRRCGVAVGLAVVLWFAGSGRAAGAAGSSRSPASEPVALSRVAGPEGWPDLTEAFEGRDGGLQEALERSLAWFDDPRSGAAYPFPSPTVTHEQARAGVAAFRELLRSSGSAGEFRARVGREFDLYASVGSDGRGTVLFTGYYAPIFRASKTPTTAFRYPLYGRPPDLVSDEGKEEGLGRRVGGAIVPYPARAEIERDPAALGLTGREIAWLDSRLDAFLVEVQGSARLEMTDGGPPVHVGYAGSNGRPYTSIGRLLVADGKIEKERLTLPAIRAYFQDHPEDLDGYVRRNDRYIFFRTQVPGDWPVGSLGVAVTPMRTLATDKSIFPLGGVVLVQTSLATAEGGSRPFAQFLLDQDTGGAIRAPGRADLYLGIGEPAGEVAGRQAHRGRLFYFILKPERVADWIGRSEASGGGG